MFSTKHCFEKNNENNKIYVVNLILMAYACIRANQSRYASVNSSSAHPSPG